MTGFRDCARRAAGSLVLLLAACSSAPPVEWQSNAKSALDRAVAAYLAGDTRVANVEFDLARRELARTGRADQVALAELTRCAVQVASLDFGPCEGFEKLRPEPAMFLPARSDEGHSWHVFTPLLPLDRLTGTRFRGGGPKLNT